ncbi:hypothetical protein PR048_015538 [Dryococelus australis]|uniref:Uncharacterized protein n=1 Tax=Dryococelus australis TaxID=614101 RepID=A0ABQ9HHA2_9NEOP|nr:hypothetical protein PR048_015538 [Dryococelus australis]
MGSSVVRKIRQARILHWNYVGFVEIPEELKDEGAHVQEIYLKCNKLSQLVSRSAAEFYIYCGLICATSLLTQCCVLQPPWLGSLSNLTNLYLHGNELTYLPDEIGELGQLIWLDVDSNHLSCLPNSIWGLHQLTALIISNNRLSIIPPDIGRLERLEYLDVSHNGLGELPDEMGKCSRLRELTTDGNPLLTLPNSITGLPCLRVITAMDCHLVYLPLLPFTFRPMLRLDHNAGLTYLPAHVLQYTRNIHYIRYCITQLSARLNIVLSRFFFVHMMLFGCVV